MGTLHPFRAGRTSPCVFYGLPHKVGPLGENDFKERFGGHISTPPAEPPIWSRLWAILIDEVFCFLISLTRSFFSPPSFRDGHSLEREKNKCKLFSASSFVNSKVTHSVRTILKNFISRISTAESIHMAIVGGSIKETPLTPQRRAWNIRSIQNRVIAKGRRNRIKRWFHGVEQL